MKSPFKVSPQYRTNPLSNIDGGVTVIIKYKDGKELEYNNIKCASAYISRARCRPTVVDAWVKA